MIRRSLIACFVVLTLAAGRAEAVTVRDVIELSKAGLSDQVLLALIEVDRSVFTIDTPTLKQLKKEGVSEAVILAMIRSGRTPPAAEPAAPLEPVVTEEPPPPPPVMLVESRQPAPAPVAYPVPVPVFIAVPVRGNGRRNSAETIIETDDGLVRARVPLPPNCVQAEPVYWGFGGKLRPGSWQPPPSVVCR